jgi:carbamate kinase
MKKIVVALGGNALQEAGKPATAEAQLEVVEKTAEHIADIIGEGYEVVVAHGNGPQVGRLVLQNEYANDITPAMPFDVCGAMSQGMIGYHIQQGLSKVLRRRGSKAQVATVVTQVVVDRNDPKFQNPSKPIGPFYKEDEAKAIAAEKGYVMKEDAGRGWRRVVASPVPVEIVELDAVKCLVDNGFVVVSVGGGGIPVIRKENGDLEGTAAVIDKDLASEKLAEDLNADALVILTAVEKVSINYNKPNQKDLSTLTVAEAKQYMAEGHFAPGSMLPKIEAAVKFVESKPGRRSIITSLDKAVEALEGKAGTTIA